ncbi:hypothetical protein Tco_1559457, partial [Tanacetum coccineum]
CEYPSVSDGDGYSIPVIDSGHTEFDAFCFSVKDFMTRWILIRCDSTRDLYLITKPSTIRHAFITSQYT